MIKQDQLESGFSSTSICSFFRVVQPSEKQIGLDNCGKLKSIKWFYSLTLEATMLIIILIFFLGVDIIAIGHLPGKGVSLALSSHSRD